MVLLVAAVVLFPIQVTDTSTYSDRATAALIDQARQRHEYQDRLVRDYTANVRTRIDVAFGRSRFARLPPIMAHETAARITWALPNDLKVDVLGERNVSIFDNGDMDAAFDRPWFIPRSLGDSIRLVDDELPSTAALHPLAADGALHYRYAISDSVTMDLPGRIVRAVKVRIEPKQLGKSLVAGDLWFDAETVEVVRFSFVFLGEYLWDTPGEETPEDSARIRGDNKWANRIIKLEADLEYALLDAEYWMPFRQLVQLTVNVPLFINATLPVRFLTTFEDYEINQNILPAFIAPPAPPEDDLEADPDTTRGAISVNVGDDPRRQRRASFRCGNGEPKCDRSAAGYFRVGESERDGRWEVHYPPADSLTQFEWPDELSLNLSKEDEERVHETIASLGRLQEQLPGDWVGRMRMGPAFESFSDIYRFNRVQGSSIGGGYQWTPGLPFTTVMATARFGLGDQRPTASLLARRDAPDGLLEVSVFRGIREVEPWTRGLGFANSMNALFTAHDDADYYLALGGAVEYAPHVGGLLRGVRMRLAFERQRSLSAFSRSSLADVFGPGRFEANTPVAQADFVTASLSRSTAMGRISFRHGADAHLQTGSTGSIRTGRFWGSASAPFALAGRTHQAVVRAGATTGDDLAQLRYRVGGPQTVRGFPYGYRWGRAFWSAQLDLAVQPSDRRTPVLFVDAGDAYGADQFFPPAGVGSATRDGPMLGAGLGWSLLRGIVRFNLSKGLRPDTGLRFDLQLAGPR